MKSTPRQSQSPKGKANRSSAITVDESLKKAKGFDAQSYNLVKIIETLKGVRHLSNQKAARSTSK